MCIPWMHMHIPCVHYHTPIVRAIDETAFDECLNVEHVRFCKEIEEFVSNGSMRD
jgi:hypothetical protein